jgi:quercetin dioxygenase-like cupin family protein
MQLEKNLQPEFVDERGFILKLLDDGKTVIKSVLLIESKKGSVRANHYHKVDSHHCYFLKGKMEYIEEDLPPKAPNRRVQIVNAGDIVYTPPMVAHAMHFLEDSTFLVLATQSRHQTKYEDDIVRVKVF